MELQHDGRLEGDVLSARVNRVEDLAVAGDLLLGPVLGSRPFPNELRDSLWGSRDALDGVGCLGALNSGRLGQRLQGLRVLEAEGILAAVACAHLAERRGAGRRDHAEMSLQVAKGLHLK